MPRGVRTAEHIVFRGQLEDGTAGAFIADADGTNIRQLPIESVDLVDFEGLELVARRQAPELHERRQPRWRHRLADQHRRHRRRWDLTELHPLKLDPDSTDERLPSWSPDSSQLAFLHEKDFTRQVGIFNADGSGYRLVGPETSTSNILSYTWSPDGKTLLITEFPDAESRREAERQDVVGRRGDRRADRGPEPGRDAGSASRPDRPTARPTRSPGISPGLRPYPRSSSGRTSFARRVCDSSS